MKVLFAVAALAALALTAADAEACSRHRRGRNNGGSLVITPRNPPLTNPPTPNPTPPPPPPPIPVGWVAPPPRPPAQEMTRTNCKARVEFHIIVDENSATSAAVDRSQIQEQWVYTCTFQVYVEVDVSETSAPTNCACGVNYQRQHPAADPNYEKAYETEITSFSMVAFDRVRNVVVGVFPPETFDKLKPNTNTTALLRSQAASNSQNYELTAKGYSGLVQAIDKSLFPSALVPGRSDYTINNVAAMCFTVQEKYISSYKWPQPPVPALYTTPNVWVSQCYPYYDFLTQSAKRDVEQGAVENVAGAPNQRYWFKEFLLFPISSDASVTRAGFTPKPRYITSWYRNSNCDQLSGVVSFDREFTYTLDRERRYDLFGAFAWTRTYESMWVVGGVPTAFGNTLSYYRTGHTKVSWKEVFGRTDAGAAHRPGVVYHALLGTPENVAAGTPFVGASERLRLCSAVPAQWERCPPGDGTGCADLRTATYDEGAYFYKAPDAADDATFNCAPAVPRCASETTFLSFQNFGSLARDYSKRRDSILLTGPRQSFCLGYPARGVFDSLYFSAYKAGTKQIRKRGVDATEQSGNVLQNLQFNADGQVIGTPASTDEPEASDVLVQPATGSADADGRAGGDHPIALFPETYTVPVTLNPADTSFDGAQGSVFDGSLAPCLEGSRGCTCRTANNNRPKCDAPLECNAQTLFCEAPTCVAGQAGCSCAAGASCSDDKLSCNSDNTCVFAQSCVAGDNGCVCRADSTCKDSDAECTEDKVCLITKPTATCEEGASGCTCKADGSCTAAGDECDEVGNVCVSPRCESGQPGCACALGRCRAGFTCKADTCVQAVCPAGDAGCACAANKRCNLDGFECKSFKTDGSDDRCVAKGKECGDQTERCVKFCGLGRVLKCPPCSNQRPVCAGAAAVVPSLLVAALLAALALLF